MKFSTLFLTFAIATSSSMLIHAAECTEDDLMSISEIYSQAMTDGTASCPDLTAAPDASDYCSFTECLRYMINMLDDLPDCTSDSVNTKEGLQAAIDICDGGTADTSDIFTETSSSSTFTADSSSSSAVATDASTSSGLPSDTSSSSSGSPQRTVAPSDSTTSDKITADSASGSSSASSTRIALSSVGMAMMALIFAVGL